MRPTKTIHLLTISLLTLLALGSCVPQQKANSSRSSTPASTGSDANPTATPSESDLSEVGQVSWYSGTSSFSNIIAINEDLSTVIYIRGTSISSFLSQSIDGITTNMQRSYCMVASFSSNGAKKNLRVRAAPISFRNLSTNEIERALRVDLPEENTSSQACSGSAFQILTTDDSADVVSNLETSFSLPDLCPNCNGIISSTNVSLYLSASPLTTNERINESLLNLNDLILRVNTSSSLSDPTGSCSQSECLAKGFDCCVEGQCVNDGAMRPNASSESDFTQALVDVGLNPNNFINWPNIYFVCSSRPTTPDPTPSPFPNADATANAFLQDRIADYNCLEEGKKANPQFSANQFCAPNFDQSSYEDIRSKVWAYCGCEADPFPTEADDPRCPDFGLIAEMNVLEEITEVKCFSPQPQVEPTPFQNLSLGVSTRSAPHRFYRADDGQSVDDISTLNPGVLPEGTPFQYADNSSKSDPDCSTNDSGFGQSECSFNMNSITGQMSVELNQALPAKVINIDFDQSYIISTVSGYYTPCPTCSADYWYQSFSAYPSSQNGVGLEAINYITNRETFQNNSTRGNYGDTSFGRACYLPPTMIPFSHKKKNNIITQRQNRIKTQAALWINGYQKDWFGFNKGALIGSFDGVSWFGIGRNRRITSDTGKLFLAINAPFADLSEPSDIIVQVVLDQGNNISPSLDYDPQYLPNDVEQGSAASCQYWHQCNTDTDCITNLGWEYMCLDTNNIESRWPKFSVEADEIANQEYDEANFNRILQAGMPTGNRKRCVYRGAGAICKRNFKNQVISSRQKMLACAPNFHCASLDEASFNSKVARVPQFIGNILYGQEANVLGRPFNYALSDQSLPNEAIENIRYNAQIYTSETIDIGLCRPGRRIDGTNFINQHSDKDNNARTDYISQVGVCDSSTFGNARTRACPIIQTLAGDSVPHNDVQIGDLILDVDESMASSQNSCGAESILDEVGNPSSFLSIEASPIPTLNNLVIPSVAADACLRRAGSVCHTDLDCGPNRLHASVASAQGNEFFGDTLAEKLYWQEELICGQSKPKPITNSDEYYDYDLGLNRCCRAVGNDFTMYTQNDDENIDSLNNNLDVMNLSNHAPSSTGRYSRYISSNPQDAIDETALLDPYAQAPIVNSASGELPKAFQWKTINDTGTSNCCGGGWIRKFQDGSTDWSNNTRFQIDPTNFECLNYISERPSDELDIYQIDPYNYQLDSDRYCLSPLEGGCAQIPFPEPTNGSILQVPNLAYLELLPSFGASPITYTLNTAPFNPPASGLEEGMGGLSFAAPFEPIPFVNANQINTEDGKRHTFFFDKDSYPAVSFYLPTYIGYIPSESVGNSNNLTAVSFQYFDEEGNNVGLGIITAVEINCGINDVDPNPANGYLDPGEFCIASDGNGVVFHGFSHEDINGDSIVDADDDWDYASVRLTYNIPNAPDFIYGPPINSTVNDRRSLYGANELYYLTKLARFELAGIPQIVYEPLYCNANKERMVEGLFSNLTTRTDFEASPNTFSMANPNYDQTGRPLIAMYDERYSSPNKSRTARYDTDGDTSVDVVDRSLVYPGANNENEYFAFNDQIETDSIFSANEFRCCTKLGQEASNDSMCCSGFRDDENLCKLPIGADLHVYFNKFVSGEGMGENLPSGGLLETDFIPETGEPKVSTEVFNKIQALGQAFCEANVTRTGGAFGYFYPQPNNGAYEHRETQDINDTRTYSIVDSTKDFDDDNNAGMNDFLAGFKWDHHIYCATPQ